jgi:hypothetical protein
LNHVSRILARVFRGSLKYFLSDNLNKIFKIINKQIINNFPDVQNLKWELNTERLAQKVKDMMKKWDLNYSMTIFPDRNDEGIKHVAINYHSGNKWLFFGGVIISKKYFSYEEVGAY